MEIAQIIILIVGAILFTVSFFIPDKQVNTKEIKEKEERIFKELVEKGLPDIRKKIDDVTEESIERAKENTQRQLERLTNEKMMAINEYSDTVMDEIHKNHEEAVFLYDMLNNKHAQVKTTTAELNQVVKESKQVQSATKSAPKVKEEKKRRDTTAVQEKVTSEEQKETVALETSFEPVDLMKEKIVMAGDTKETSTKEAGTGEQEEKSTRKESTGLGSNVEIMFATDGNEANSNDQILELHKAGKSNMAIARELGLGIGEVKLVIDLFKGGM